MNDLVIVALLVVTFASSVTMHVTIGRARRARKILDDAPVPSR